jgi:hypothetical protein
MNKHIIAMHTDISKANIRLSKRKIFSELIDVTFISGAVPMRAGGVIKPPSIARGIPGAYAPGEPSAVIIYCTPSCVALPIPLLPTTMRKSRYSRIHP